MTYYTPALSSQLTLFFNQNKLSVLCNPFIDGLITLDEGEGMPSLFEILICKQRGAHGHLATLQVVLEYEWSTVSLSYQRMEEISE